MAQHEKGIDWDLIEIPAVRDACSRAARGVATQYGEIMEYGDALQEAYIVAATNPEKVQGYLADESFGYLNRWIWQRVTNLATGRARKQSRDVSYEALFARAWEAAE